MHNSVNRAAVGIIDHIRAFARVGVVPGKIGGGDKKLEALDVSGRTAYAVIHITAGDPSGIRRHAHLVTHPVIADHGAGGVRAMSIIVTGNLQVVTAGIRVEINLGVDGVPPIVIVVSLGAVPTAVLFLRAG